QKVRMFTWAAGLRVDTQQPGFPRRLTEGADVFTCSIGFGDGFLLSEAVKDLFDHLTNRGRRGKGCLTVFSAGNDGREIRIRRPFGTYERSISCAASTLQQGQGGALEEVRAPYSNFGKSIEWCVPSSSEIRVISNPPTSFAVWTSCIPGSG